MLINLFVFDEEEEPGEKVIVIVAKQELFTWEKNKFIEEFYSSTPGVVPVLPLLMIKEIISTCNSVNFPFIVPLGGTF